MWFEVTYLTIGTMWAAGLALYSAWLRHNGWRWCDEINPWIQVADLKLFAAVGFFVWPLLLLIWGGVVAIHQLGEVLPRKLFVYLDERKARLQKKKETEVPLPQDGPYRSLSAKCPTCNHTL